MKKKFLMAMSMMLIVSAACFSNTLSEKKERKASGTPALSQRYNGLDLSGDQLLELRKIDQSFFSKHQEASGKERKAQVKKQQKERDKRQKEFAKRQKKDEKTQREYLQAVRKVMNETQYVAFLENQWFRQSQMSETPGMRHEKRQSQQCACCSPQKQQKSKEACCDTCSMASKSSPRHRVSR